MKKNVLFILFIVALFSCKSKTSENKTADSTTTIAADTVASATKPVSAEETLCFEHREEKDNTTVKLIIKGDAVTGEMNWTPWEKDGAVGSLKGKKVTKTLSIIKTFIFVEETLNPF